MKQSKIAGQNELVLNHRETAFRLMRSMMRRWGFRLDRSEAQSIADMALCEAAKRFKPGHNATFVTYLFHFLRGALIAELKRQRRASLTMTLESSLSHVGDEGERRDISPLESLPEAQNTPEANRHESPEVSTYRDELKEYCEKALQLLTPLEREVVIGIHMNETKVAHFAREIGYSRGHVSELRRQAFKKLAPELMHLAA